MTKPDPIERVSAILPFERPPAVEGEARWESAAAKLAVLKMVLADERALTQGISAAAAEHGTCERTLWLWLKAYRAHGIAGLLDKRGRHGKGKSRLPPETERVTADVINTHGLTRQKRKPVKVHAAIVQACENDALALRAPSYATVRRRMAAIHPRAYIAAREGEKAAREKLDPVGRSFAHLAAPLDLAQIDHWEADIIVVDEESHEPMGRPWVSVAFDVFSRCVLGLYVTIAAPCSASTATCLARAIKPKGEWLASHGLTIEWPFLGVMRVLHSDNADDLIGRAVSRGCSILDIEQQSRRKWRAADGGHIERFFRTLAEHVHTLPGTTFSSPSQRGSYDSEREACLTVLELEKHIATWIGDIYHHTRHDELGCTPYEKWQSTEPYRCPKPYDDMLVNILFLPFRPVTVTRAGIRLFNLIYQADVLRRWIGIRRDDLLASYDPRDMSRIYFFDPDLQRYFAIACRDMRVPAPTLACVQGVARKIRRRGERISPQRLADALNRLDAIVDAADAGTKAARRKREGARRPADTTPAAQAERATPGLSPPVDDFVDGPVRGYRSEIMRRSER